MCQQQYCSCVATLSSAALGAGGQCPQAQHSVNAGEEGYGEWGAATEVV